MVVLQKFVGFVCEKLNVFRQVSVAEPEVGTGVVDQMREVRPAA